VARVPLSSGLEGSREEADDDSIAAFFLQEKRAFPALNPMRLIAVCHMSITDLKFDPNKVSGSSHFLLQANLSDFYDELTSKSTSGCHSVNSSTVFRLNTQDREPIGIGDGEQCSGMWIPWEFLAPGQCQHG
jgi:hypothetical protein